MESYNLSHAQVPTEGLATLGGLLIILSASSNTRHEIAFDGHCSNLWISPVLLSCFLSTRIILYFVVKLNLFCLLAFLF